MKWLKNLESLAQNKDAGQCPYCRSSHTDYLYTIVDVKSRMGCVDIWCTECLKAFHISRVQIPVGAKMNGQIPNDVRY